MCSRQQILDDDKKYYWSPSVRWERKNSEVRIETFSYPERYAELFPKLYFIAQRGIILKNLLSEFPIIDEEDLREFIYDLIRKRILVSSMLTPSEIFYPISITSQDKLNERLICDAKEIDRFKTKQLNRKCTVEVLQKIVLTIDDEYPPIISNRISYRHFDTETPIPFASISRLLSILSQRRMENNIRYYYASAGGLYPFDIYVYVKEGRVSKVQKGLYYFDPTDSSLNLINDSCIITKKAHCLPNQVIFEESAISIYLIYNSEVTVPKYGGMGYFYACIDVGIIVGTITLAAELSNIGICSIGYMNFKKIQKYFRLNSNQVYLHSVECGIKPSK